jgi:hypothetical protein
MDKKQFIKEIQRRFPENDIETLQEAIDRCEGTEYEYIFSETIETLSKMLVPSREEILEEMELHNADEVGIDNQWTFEDAEYHLLLSDKYYNQ